VPLEDKIKTCIDYTLKVLLGDENANAFRKYISYSQPGSKMEGNVGVRVIPSGFFGADYGKPSSLPRLPLAQVEGTPLLYGTPQIQSEHGRLNVHADIIASTFFLVTRYEEMVRRDVRDEHGRFPGKESLPYRAGFMDRPVVDEYAVLLRKWLKQAGVDVPEPKRSFSILPTHDVDIVRKYQSIFQPFKTLFGVMLYRRPLRDIPESLAVALGFKKDPYDTFGQMAAIDESDNVGLRRPPTYFFMAGGKSEFDGKYDIFDDSVKNTIRMIQESGATIGLHTSYEAGMKPELIAHEKEILEEVCGSSIYRNRHHYLSLREIEDCRGLQKAGMTWDSSLGYADVAGFRLGVCRPIELFDPAQMMALGIEEHPLIVMDRTLSNANYMNLNEDEAFCYCQKLLEQTRKHRGEFVMLWHNTVFVPEDGNYHPRLYRKLCDEFGHGGVSKQK
jgi:hypothetical protein